MQELWDRGSTLLHNAIRTNWKFSIEKGQCGTSISFCGLELSADANLQVTVLPSNNTIKELINFDSPRTKRQLQSLLGVLNTLVKWIPGLSNHNSRMRELNRG